MMTRWGRALNRDAVLNDYPRPQMVRDNWRNLNGTWSYAITTKQAPQPTIWDGEILVPFCVESALSGVQRTVTPDDRLWYRRTFSIADTNSHRQLLHFGAVDYECTIWVNGGLAGSHTGGFDPFYIDISDYVTAGDNELVVAVTDPTSSEDQPRGKQHLKPQGIWYTPVTGIWQTVWLEAVPVAASISELAVAATIDCNGIEFSGFLHRPSRDPQLALRVRILLRGESVKEVIVRPDRRVTISIPEPELWFPGAPVLYDLDVALLRIANPLPDNNEQSTSTQLLRDVPLHGDRETALYNAADLSGAEVIDQVRGYFGLRRIELGPHPDSGHPVLLLNGKPLFHLGPLDQGWWPDGLHTPPSDEAMIYELEFLKAAGFNTLRKHIKVEPARYYYHCDRLGIMVWQDMPSGFLPAQFVAPNDDGEALRSGRSTAAYEIELQQMIQHLKAHPSIVVWVLHNEGWGQFDTERLTRRLRDLDPSRLINSISGWRDMGVGDMIDKHDYNAEVSAPPGNGQRALVIGEYGGIGWPVDGHLWNPRMRNWGYQTLQSDSEVQQAYQQVTESIVRIHQQHGVCAAIYTQTTDVEGEVNGLITYDRECEKLDAQWLAQTHQLLTGQS